MREIRSFCQSIERSSLGFGSKCELEKRSHPLRWIQKTLFLILLGLALGEATNGCSRSSPKDLVHMSFKELLKAAQAGDEKAQAQLAKLEGL